MSSDERLAQFSGERRRLFGLAYRMLGSVSEAEDALQEAWLRFAAADLGELQSPPAWLTRVLTRICLDVLKSARRTREEYVGPWLPEPVRTDERVDADSLSMAFLLLLESLSPSERAAFLLCEVFDYSAAEAGELLELSDGACRQLLYRARSHVKERRPRFSASREAHQRLWGAFMGAITAGDLDGLRGLLRADVRSFSDGGGKATAARKVVEGSDAVARFWMGVVRRGLASGRSFAIDVVEVNGLPGLAIREGGKLMTLMTLSVVDERIDAIHAVLNPDKLSHWDEPPRL